MRNRFLNIKTYFVAASLSVAAISCTEDNVINTEPIDQVKEGTVFTTPSTIALAVNGVYQAAQQGWYDGAPRGYPFGGAYFQQNDMRGEDMVNTAAFYAYTYTTTWDASGTANNIHYWLDSYRLINRANLVIEGVTTSISQNIIPKDIGDDYIGQSLFFRGFTHFELLRHFSRPYNDTPDASHMGVVYRTVATKNPETIAQNSPLGRTSVAENYKQVLADLDLAESLIKSRKHDIVYVGKEAVIALKVKVYLAMRNWPKVIEEANKIDGIYTLTDSPNGVFAANLSNKESIFSLANSANNNPGVNAALASQYKGRQLVAISPILWNDPAWLADDKRREKTNFTDNSTTAMIIESSTGGLYTNKYKDQKTLTDTSPLLRYAEVLLNRAEAKARTGDMAGALADLNAVRNRSLANPATQAYTSFASVTDILKAIIMEKRIEFLAEGNRWADIHRLQKDDLIPTSGIPAKYANGAEPRKADYKIGVPHVISSRDVAAIPYSSHLFLWPIPTREVSANPVLAAQQNPGY